VGSRGALPRLDGRMENLQNVVAVGWIASSPSSGACFASLHDVAGGKESGCRPNSILDPKFHYVLDRSGPVVAS
jgi:hypothetical protein